MDKRIPKPLKGEDIYDLIKKHFRSQDEKYYCYDTCIAKTILSKTVKILVKDYSDLRFDTGWPTGDPNNTGKLYYYIVKVKSSSDPTQMIECYGEATCTVPVAWTPQYKNECGEEHYPFYNQRCERLWAIGKMIFTFRCNIPEMPSYLKPDQWSTKESWRLDRMNQYCDNFTYDYNKLRKLAGED
jgi:hypothetical protein